MFIYVTLGLVAGIALGAGLLYAWQQKQLKTQRRIPREWPLKLRPLVNSQERQVWIWLSKVMFDQQILIKLPVTRFTAPAEQAEAPHWYKILNGLYCTFTVCDTQGRVIGCVDVPGSKGLSMSNQTLKHSLLAQCGVRYWVVDPENLPHLAQIRTAFLGEHAVKGAGRDDLEMRFRNVRDNLQAAVTRQRSHGQASDRSPRSDAEQDTPESRLPSGWDQNSFVTPLDSRMGDISR